MDLEKFRGTLSDREGECLDYFMDNIRQEDIASIIGVSQTLVSFILSTVFIKFSAFYCENIEEDVGIDQFKKHLSKSELEYFEMYLDGHLPENIAEKVGSTKSLTNLKLNSVFSKFYDFFGVKLNG
jgi:hypothetical protein